MTSPKILEGNDCTELFRNAIIVLVEIYIGDKVGTTVCFLNRERVLVKQINHKKNNQKQPRE